MSKKYYPHSMTIPTPAQAAAAKKEDQQAAVEPSPQAPTAAKQQYSRPPGWPRPSGQI